MCVGGEGEAGLVHTDGAGKGREGKQGWLTDSLSHLLTGWMLCLADWLGQKRLGSGSVRLAAL